MFLYSQNKVARYTHAQVSDAKLNMLFGHNRQTTIHKVWYDPSNTSTLKRERERERERGGVVHQAEAGC